MLILTPKHYWGREFNDTKIVLRIVIKAIMLSVKNGKSKNVGFKCESEN